MKSMEHNKMAKEKPEEENSTDQNGNFSEYISFMTNKLIH